ncbi:hypothetical protein Pcinc_043013 [Petrolisthes cinctipes]|uniref:Fibronectin type-III domain-containing protein n=1 Tax=Petrolisthes cinctipes TaxID=88211 RepID=A0AAE1BJJ2_PETCI|nr:hypothetical protein Pcinc_043013 [Petrolisthes cinctipes]
MRGKPEPPKNCTALEGTKTSVRVFCVAGSSGGLTQHFTLHAIRRHAPHHHLNLTAQAAPDFLVSGLSEGGQYEVAIRAVNKKGTSAATRLTLTSTPTANTSLYHLHDGPFEAEVREGGTGVTDGGGSVLQGLALPSLLLGLLGLSSGVVLLLVLTLLLLFARRRRRLRGLVGQKRGSRSGSAGSPGCSHASTLLTPEQHTTTCLEEMQVHSESDSDPDVIPLQESLKGGDPDHARPPATLLSPQHYKFPSVPVSAVVSGSGSEEGPGRTANLQPSHFHLDTSISTIQPPTPCPGTSTIPALSPEQGPSLPKLTLRGGKEEPLTGTPAGAGPRRKTPMEGEMYSQERVKKKEVNEEERFKREGMGSREEPRDGEKNPDVKWADPLPALGGRTQAEKTTRTIH